MNRRAGRVPPGKRSPSADPRASGGGETAAMSSVMSPASADEALEMLRSAMGYLAAADATAMTAEEQARCLRVLEHVTSTGTAARTSVLGAFAHGQGPGADAEYSPRAWLIHKTGVTKGAAVSYTAWVRRAEEHPVVFTALAAGDLPESVARIVCQWTNRLPEDQRDAADDKLVAAALAGMSLQDLAGAGRAVRGDLRAVPVRVS